MNINCNGNIIDFTSPKIMGILNVTPNSFYDGGKHNRIDTALLQTEKMISEGATFIDVGGASSKPGVEEVSPDEELKRVLPVIEKISKNFPHIYISIDTYRSNVARQAVDAGAQLVNDISAGNADDNMLKTVGKLGVPYIAMHMQGTPKTMQNKPTYDDVLIAIRSFFSEKIAAAHAAGINDIIVDPGFGFGKTPQHNFALLNHLNTLQIDGVPLLVGVSRKSMIYKTLNIDIQQALNGTTVLHTVALRQGAHLLRVHDVKEAKQAVDLIKALDTSYSINP
ncbi:MAG: dihydropteroate synthase [Flavobacteriales bacterium]|jgi:dihydropteroate synthase|nr:MAG: dihydropteroate synthase [Flavobacteriales bacterium]|tara:strand:- start:7278 stop:8120 length:843 start_codon:yes stop_codon:yes gene_type:complete